MLGRGTAWLDTGTHESLLKAGQFVQLLEERQGLKVGCLQEIAWNRGWISTEAFRREVEAAGSSSYGAYLREALAAAEDGRAGG
jgi:glucose-1-phosphate thymidylyltransferase